MIYGSWFRNKLEEAIPGYEQYTPYDKGEGLYGRYYSNPPWLIYPGEVASLSGSQGNNTSVLFGKKVKKLVNQQNNAFIPSILTEIALPNAEVIGEAVFSGGRRITKIFLPKVKVLENRCFSNLATYNKTLFFPLVERIGTDVFVQAEKLPGIHLPKLLVVSDRTFSYCKSLTNVDLPLVQELKTYAFNGCDALRYINLPSAIVLGYGVFYSCKNLSSANFPLVRNVGTYCFYSCTSLKTLDLPSAINIEERAFENCNKLYILKIPSATTFGSNCFEGCSALKNITCKRGYKPYVQNALTQSGITQQVTITEV